MNRAIFFFLCGLSSLPAHAAPAATAFAVNGAPKLRKAGSPDAELKVGAALAAGETVITGAGASAKLLLEDRSVVDVSPNSSFRIESLEGAGAGRQAELRTDFGKVRAAVNRKLEKKGRFLMRTPSTVMAVRGTEFVVASLPGTGDEANLTRETVTVLDGKVEVRDPASKDEPVVLERGRRMNVYLEFARAKIREVVRQAIRGQGAQAKRKQEVQTLDEAELALQIRESRLVESNFRQLTVLAEGGETTVRAARKLIPPAPPGEVTPSEIRTPATAPRGLIPDWRR